MSFIADFLVFAILLSKISISENISSKLIVSISLIGSTLPSTWMIFESSKHLTTWIMASHSRIFDKNWLPSPSPLLAPFTRPAISTKSISAGVTFFVLYNLPSSFNLSSGTATTPTLGSIVAKG